MHLISYNQNLSSITPALHYPELPVPTPPTWEQPFQKSKSIQKRVNSSIQITEAQLRIETHTTPPQKKDLNDLIRYLGLTYSNAELLTSRFKQWSLLDESVQVAGQRKRHLCFSSSFTFQDGHCFCHTVTGLFEATGITCNPNDASSLTGHPGASNPCCFITGHVFISSLGSLGATQWNTTASRSC